MDKEKLKTEFLFCLQSLKQNKCETNNKVKLNKMLQMYSDAIDAAELLHQLKPHIVLNHNRGCNITADWSEFDEAMADTPTNLRDEKFYLSIQEAEEKRKTCTCGVQILKTQLEEFYKTNSLIGS